jgi:hypothetical protein
MHVQHYFIGFLPKTLPTNLTRLQHKIDAEVPTLEILWKENLPT